MVQIADRHRFTDMQPAVICKSVINLLSVLLCLFFSTFKVHAAETIAISYFDNTSRVVTYDPLSKGISDMLITDLSKIEGITIVERSRLEELLKEIQLNKSKYFDEATAQKLGKGLGAKSILTGAYLLLNDNLRIDARLVDVQSGKILMAESVNCGKDDFFTGYKQLVELISKQLKLSVSSSTSLAPKGKAVGIDAVVQYSKAIDFADKGLNDDASTLLASTVKQYPDFGFAKSKLEELKAWMKEMDRQHEAQVAAETKKLIANIDVKNPQFGQDINKVWTLLLTSWSYSKIIAFNHELRAKNISYDLKLYGEASPITFGEMLLYYESLSYSTLKDHAKTIETGKQFMEKYPASMYYSGIKTFMEQAVEELEKREKGKAMIDAELLKTELITYVDHFDGYLFRKWIKLMSRSEYDFFRNIYLERVLGFGDEMLKEMVAGDKFSMDELFSFRKAAESYGDIAMLNCMAAKSKIFGDEAIRIEEQLVYSKKKIEEADVFAAEAKRKYEGGNERDIEQLVRNSGEIDAVFEEKVMRLYLKQSAGAKNNYYRYDAWKNLVTSLLGQGRPDDAKAELKNFQNDKILFAEDSLRFKRELLNFKNEFTEMLKTLEENKGATLQMLVYEKKAETALELHQYADEAATRLQLLNNFNLPADKSELQLFKLVYAYYNLGYFDQARKFSKQLQQKHPGGSFATSIESLVKYMPQ